MTRVRKTLTTHEKLEQERLRFFELAEKYEEQLIFERLKPEQRKELDMMFRRYQRDYGEVSFQSWLRAVVRSMRDNIVGLNQLLVHELLPRTATDEQKIKYLRLMAKLMRVDVTISKRP